MTCPNDEKWSLLSMNLLEAWEVSELNEHLLTCTACRAKFSRARRDNAALVRTYETLDRDHDQQREQLMASLPQEAPHPAPVGWGASGRRRLGDYVMNSPRVRWTAATVAAAACILLAFSLFVGVGNGVALADVGQAIQQTKTMLCRTAVTIVGGELEQSFEGKSYLSGEHGSRTDLYTDGQLIMTSITPLDGPTVSGQPGGGAQFRISFADRESFEPSQIRPDDYIRRLWQLTGEADRQLGSDIIDGHEALGFEIGGDKLGLVATSAPSGTIAEAVATLLTLWVDSHTLLPLRYSVRMPGPEDGSVLTVACDDFEWDVALDESLFDTSTIESDEKPPIDLKVPSATEEALVEGLGIYLEFTRDSYPSALNFVKIGMDFYKMAGSIPQDERPDWGEPQEMMQRMMPLYAGTLFYRQLLEDGAEPEYFGPQVKPGDADAVLVRWQLESGETRVIYGDLHAETLPAAD